MKKFILFCSMGVIIFCGALNTKTQTNYTYGDLFTSFFTTNKSVFITHTQPQLGLPFLTLTNQQYIRFKDGSCLVRISDSNWNTITNQFSKNIVTTTIRFYNDK